MIWPIIICSSSGRSKYVHECIFSIVLILLLYSSVQSYYFYTILLRLKLFKSMH